MKLIHPCIKSPLFKVVSTFEIDVEFGDDSFTLRIELFRSHANSKLYRYRISRTEMFSMQPMFPEDEKGSPPEPTTETIFIEEWGLKYLLSGEEFRANNNRGAIAKIIKDFGKALEHVSSKKMKVVQQ